MFVFARKLIIANIRANRALVLGNIPGTVTYARHALDLTPDIVVGGGEAGAAEFLGIGDPGEAGIDGVEIQIVDQATGTIVATSTVQISECAVSHGNITVSVATTTQ